MKKLYLIRHAKSSWSEAGLSDFERPLNQRGNRDAPFMSKLLKEKNVKPDRIISSSAIRAFSTAKIFANELNYAVDDILNLPSLYEAIASEILEIIQSVDDNINSLMVFGHNPGLTSLSNHLSDRQVDNMPTCSISCIDFETNSWKNVNIGTGKLVAFEFPKKYLKTGD